MARDTQAARELAKALESAGETVLANGEAAERFGAEQPTVAPIDASKQKEALAGLTAGRRQLALGHLAEAEAALRPIERLEEAELDFLRRTHASVLYEVCWTRAHIILRSEQASAARRAMVDCIATYPTLPPPTPPEVRQLYDDAKKSISFANLVVNGPAGCTGRVFGVAVGGTPLTLRVAAGPTSVQLECSEDMLGRRHLIDVGAGTSSIEIDPRFDRVVVTTGGVLRFVYDEQAARRSHRDEDADRLGRVLSARVILVQSDDGTTYHLSTPAVREGGLGDLRYDIHAGAAHADLRRIVQTLRQQESGAVDANAGGRTSVGAAEAQSEPSATTATPGVAQQGGWARPVAGTVLGVLGVGALATGWALYATRQDYRLEARPEISEEVLRSFRARGTWMLAISGTAAAGLLAAEYLLLPQADGIPVPAWLAGAAGAVAAAVGVAYAVGSSHCDPMALATGTRISKTCYSRTSDGLFGPMLMLNSLPLLNAPLVYLFRAVVGGVDHRLSLTPAGLEIQGRF